ncbi:hypothetical protein ABBQ38_004353 [Trebouxia sp. C0009 RCD-2024]
MESQASGGEAPQRRKLNLKPRDENAASKAEAEKTSSRSNPFGAAKPRETVLAAKLGKKEEDILKEELSKDRINLRLDPEQNDQKRAAEEAVKEVEDELEAETDESKLEALKAEVAGRKEKLSTLIDGFQKMAMEKAKAGGGMRPSERRAQQMLQQGPGGYGDQPNGGGSYEGRGGGRGGYGGDYGNTRARPEPSAGGYQAAPQYGGGYDSYGAGGGRQGDQQSFGGPRAGGGGFDSYNDRGPPGGSRGRGRGRADSGEFQSAGSFGSAAPDGPAAEYTSPFTGQDRF